MIRPNANRNEEYHTVFYIAYIIMLNDYSVKSNLNANCLRTRFTIQHITSRNQIVDFDTTSANNNNNNKRQRPFFRY